MTNDDKFAQTFERIANILEILEKKVFAESSLLGTDKIDDIDEMRANLQNRIAQQVEKLGAIHPLINDPTVNDILINGAANVYVERNGKLEKTGINLGRDAEVIRVANEIVETVGRKLDRRRPLVDARLLDGSRVNVIAPPLAVDGTTISIRKFSTRAITLDVMIEQGNINKALADILYICAASRMNVLISGGTGSGKTTLLNAVSRGIDHAERIVTIEDAAELKLQQPHIIRLETKPFEIGGNRDMEVTMRDLVKNSLRMRPDRIIVGEVRGPEAFDMMQAMNTGHEGSMTTIHANHPRDALSRLENMIMMANLGIPMKAIRYQIASALNVIVQVSRMRDGHRRITHVSEVVGMEGEIITLQDLFNFVPDGGIGKDGKLTGKFIWSGIVPRFVRRVAYWGHQERLAKALGLDLGRIN